MASPLTPTTPLYRLFNSDASDHFYTVSDVERVAVTNFGYVDEGVACHVVAQPAPGGTVPLFRTLGRESALSHTEVAVHPARKVDHFYTSDSTERDKALVELGHLDEGIACYVFPRQVPGTVPLYRLHSPSTGESQVV